MFQKILIISILFALNHRPINGQNSYSISGQLRVRIVSECLVPTQPLMIGIKSLQKYVFADSLGNFIIDGLDPGQYRLKIIGFGYRDLDTVATIVNESIKKFNLHIPVDCEINAEVAKNDIKNNEIRILIVGGIAPVRYYSDSLFEQKYNLYFH